MDVPQDKEALFNEVYDKEHIPYLSEVPGVLAIARFTTEPLKMVIGGVEQEIIIENQPKHTFKQAMSFIFLCHSKAS